MFMGTTVWLTGVFLIVFVQQWSSVAQRNKIYQALDTQTTLGSIVHLGLFVEFDDNKKIIDR